jgi:hypothetical protein
MLGLQALVGAVGQRVGGLFSKDFLFSSFIPLMLLSAIFSSVFAAVTGVSGSLSWLESISGLGAVALTGSVIGGLLMFAYVLLSLRVVITALWSGVYPLWPPPPLRLLAYALAERRRGHLRSRAQSSECAKETINEIGAAVEKRADASAKSVEGKILPDPDKQARQRFITASSAILKARSIQTAEEGLQEIETLYCSYKPELLDADLQQLVNEIRRNSKQMAYAENQAASDLKRDFGPDGTLKPTRLGNLLEAHAAYPFERYNIEASVFWPRLMMVMPPERLVFLDDQRQLADFWLNIATLALFSAPLSLGLGPLLAPKPALWLVLAGAALVVSYAAYRLGTAAALHLGERLCAACDMFRFDVAKKLRMPPVSFLRIEKEHWGRLSKHSLYGLADFGFDRPPPRT